jgi:hypothetical protein
MLDAASGSTQPRKRLPTWALVLIALGALALAVAVVLVVHAQLVSVNERNVGPLNSAVGEKVLAIQAGVQAWAAEHGGTYPDPSLVTQEGLAAYVSDWPTNGFSDEPMKQGTQSGDFSYTVAPDGASYQLVGYGDERKEVITVP